MRKFIISVFITTLLVASFCGTATAQDKHEYATITHSGGFELFLSYDEKPYEKIKLTKEEVSGQYNFSAALKKVTQMESEGWELLNTVGVYGAPTVLFILRRERK